MNITATLNKVLPASVTRLREQSLYWPTVLSHAVVPHGNRSIFINGFQNSGTNWLCQLTSNYFDVPIFEAWTRWTPGFVGPYVFHLHRFLNTAQVNDRTIYITRDGRDTTVSRFYKAARTPKQSHLRNQIKAQAGFDLDESQIKTQLPQFIEWDFTHRQRSSVNWAEHIRKARALGVRRISFEGLKADAAATLTPIFEEIGKAPVDQDKLARVIEARKFENVRGTGTTYHKRSGSVGEWQQHFSPEARQAFAKYAGSELIWAGYEADDAWAAEPDTAPAGSCV
ncbi:sulfotransferase domain-containing protein [Shimia ponticola]|uniref:sulfotransferase domain-containing protein n=1 Tax=Shimia ponticola TaxID=2582893 RepID=UPI0011BD45FE|nr:sulfotransferase domain-containing protein [Shimia ponticola]